MLIEASIPLRVRLRSGDVCLRPGHPIEFRDEDGQKLLARAPGKVRRVMPESPLQPGWLVAYRDRDGRLRGGCDEREAGTVKECRWEGKEWTVSLTDGQRLPMSIIRSVGQTDSDGKLIAAWTVREHGYDGEGPLSRED